MKFNSQICTTKEQSERLLTLGLKKETADCVMMYYDGWHIGEAEHFDFDKDPVDPAWSLHRLFELYTDGYNNSGWNMAKFNWDRLIDCIEMKILEGYFNKEYLEE